MRIYANFFASEHHAIIQMYLVSLLLACFSTIMVTNGFKLAWRQKLNKIVCIRTRTIGRTSNKDKNHFISQFLALRSSTTSRNNGDKSRVLLVRLSLSPSSVRHLNDIILSIIVSALTFFSYIHTHKHVFAFISILLQKCILLSTLDMLSIFLDIFTPHHHSLALHACWYICFITIHSDKYVTVVCICFC